MPSSFGPGADTVRSCRIHHHDMWLERLHQLYRLLAILGFADDLNRKELEHVLAARCAGSAPTHGREQGLQAVRALGWSAAMMHRMHTISSPAVTVRLPRRPGGHASIGCSGTQRAAWCSRTSPVAPRQGLRSTPDLFIISQLAPPFPWSVHPPVATWPPPYHCSSRGLLSSHKVRLCYTATLLNSLSSYSLTMSIQTRCAFHRLCPSRSHFAVFCFDTLTVSSLHD